MKTIYSILSALLLLALSACSSDPFVGEWMSLADNAENTSVDIKSNGTIMLITDAEDGYAEISGSWARVSDSDNTIKVKFDANTIELDFDNPIEQMLMQQVLEEFATVESSFVLSEDGNYLENKGNRAKAFVRK